LLKRSPLVLARSDLMKASDALYFLAIAALLLATMLPGVQ